jgi:hypothetical protein
LSDKIRSMKRIQLHTNRSMRTLLLEHEAFAEMRAREDRWAAEKFESLHQRVDALILKRKARLPDAKLAR